MAVRESRLKVSLIDGVTGAAARIAASLTGIGRAARGASGVRFGDQLAASATTARSAVTGLHTKLIAATAGAFALSRAVKSVVNPTAAFETKLLDIAQKADLSDSAMVQLGGSLRKLAKDVGRGAGDMAGGMDTLLGMGLDKDKALGVLPTIAKAATAYGADIVDLSKASMASLDNLKVRVDEFPKALDAMARAGKEGAFELNDMARYMPTLASLGQTLKLKGVAGVSEIASALQVIRKGAGTSEEAATRLSDVFGKITSEETKKKFKKLGVNIQGDLKKAQAQAEKTGKPFSAIDFIVGSLNKALKGDIGRIGEIFQDKEARLGAIALMEYYKEFQHIREAANKASGEVERDYARRAGTFAAASARFRGAAEELGIALGSRVLPSLTTFMSSISGILNTLDERVSVFDKMGKAISGFMSGLGFGDGSSVGELLSKLSDGIFGSLATFEADADRLAQTFKQFQEIGQSVSAFARSLAQAAQAIASFAGLDISGLSESLGTLAGYGFKFALAAGALGLLAVGLRKVGSALLFLTGIKAAVGVVKMLGGLAGGLGIGAAGAAAGGAAAGAASKIGTNASPRAMTPDELAKAKAGSPGLGWKAMAGGALLGGLQTAIAGAFAASIAMIGEANRKHFEGVEPGEQHDEGRKRRRAYHEKLRQEAEELRRQMEGGGGTAGPTVDGSGIDDATTKAGAAKDKLSELNATVTPNVNMSQVSELEASVDRILAKFQRVGSVAGTAKSSIAAASASEGRGRSPIAQATAALERSRQTSQEDRAFV